jgi:7-alpha-hydroxysteroid dehydrogenase
MSFSIAGKTAIVTGAANGIGLAIARRFAAEGANVMFADADEARLQAEIGEAAEAEGTIRYFSGDLRERLSQANLVSATLDAFERVDILVNAARSLTVSDPLEAEADAVEEMLRANMLSALRLSQTVAKRMIRQAEDAGGGEGPAAGQAGAIVNISSIAARRTGPSLLGYSIAAAAMDQMTRALAVALAPHRIRVNAVAFGSVMSASLRDALKDHAEFREDITDHTPMARIAAPGELADAVQFLASEGAGFVTGQILTVDGGRTLIDPVAAQAH